ncbi:MAG: SapC family protein [Pseudomonadales bacterium]|nr:SapC family protein [Pseudomonadales bacterium]
MSTLLFYKEPVALNREQHKAIKFTAQKDYGFTKDTNSVPLTGIEFFEASRDYPVLFSKDDNGEYFPLALLSLLDGDHHLVDDKGQWDDIYIPAFIRRYPFALTDEGTVCFDAKAPHFESDDGKALFNEEGENSEALSNAINFLNHFDAQHKHTRAFCEAAKESDLFKAFNVQVMVEKDKPLRLEGLYIIDEEKLGQLSEDQVNNWFKQGWLAWSYAHMHSLGAIRRLVKRQQNDVEDNSAA